MRRTLFVLTVLLLVLGTVSAGAPATAGPDADPASYWTADRVESAIPRDLVIDDRGLGYLRLPTGELRPYGHSIAVEGQGLRSVPFPMAKPVKAPGGGGGGGSDTTPPVVVGLDPSGTTIGVSYTFSAVVTDNVGVRSVTMYVRLGTSGAYQSFAMTNTSDNTWQTALVGFTDGDWQWYVVAKDTAKRGGNTTTSNPVGFTVDTGGTPPPSGVVTNAEWSGGGMVQTAAGRLLFEMPANRQLTRWNAYVCSGTVVTDTADDGKSIVLTAAHCVYDDANKAFARNVIFIPDQGSTTGTTGTDWDCGNDPFGCWSASAGVVDVNWTTRTFPNNVAWDYAYYVFLDGSHSGAGSVESLESAAGNLSQSFNSVGSTMTHALGYSYSDDPNLMYCAENLAVLDGANYWLGNCELSGGSSGGPWLQLVSDGEGPIISVNSWGYTTAPGMAGPKLYGTSASCVFSAALTAEVDTKTC